MSNSSQLLQSLVKALLEHTSLIMMEVLWVPEMTDKILKYLFSCSLSRLILCWVRLCKSHEVGYHFTLLRWDHLWIQSELSALFCFFSSSHSPQYLVASRATRIFHGQDEYLISIDMPHLIMQTPQHNRL